MTEILGYGEDALTLWALKYKLKEILILLQDHTEPTDCVIFYRPSCGRGGRGPSIFGEFDFIILANNDLYLGESKWDGGTTKGVRETTILDYSQLLRHELFEFYVREWSFGDYVQWEDFRNCAVPKLRAKGIQKPIAPTNSLLAKNLKTSLSIIREHFIEVPKIRNVLLYLHRAPCRCNLPMKVANKNGRTIDGFETIHVDYGDADCHDNYVKFAV